MNRLAVAVLGACLACACAAHADPEPAANTRTDVIAVRLVAPASASIPGRDLPRAAGSAPGARPAAGALGVLADRLGLAFEPAFPVARPSRAVAAAPALEAVADRQSRDWVVRVPAGVPIAAALAELRATPGVERAEPVWELPVTAVPNDSLWNKAYYFYQPSRRDAHAPEAWDITTGDSTQVIGIIDTGVLMNHPDLAGSGPGIGGNIWTNALEANGQPGVDDDGNGYVDDVHGWDFVELQDSTLVSRGEDWQGQDADPNDYVGHGTGVAGIAAAITNNTIGVAGTAGGARIMPLRVGYSASTMPGGMIDELAIARAIDYAAVTGATVINCSFATVPSFLISDALDHAWRVGMVVVFAAGNNNSVHAMQDRHEVISVAATDSLDRLTAFSNTGAYVDLAAAGLFVSTTTLRKVFGPDGELIGRDPVYSASASGTSFSAPIVAGAVALIQADARARGKPRLDPVSVQLRLVETADDIAAQNPFGGYGSGRVNFLRALTDPPSSYAVRLDGNVAGAAAVVHSRAGHTLIVVATGAPGGSGRLVGIDGATRDVVWNQVLPAAPLSSPAVADLGGGRGPGIFVTVASGQICGYDDAGFPLSGWPVSLGGPLLNRSFMAVGDVNGDGAPEVVCGDRSARIHALRVDGSELPGFPAVVGTGTETFRVALADLDGGGVADIVAGSPSGTVTVLAGDGRPLPGWPRNLGYRAVAAQPPVVALLEADRRPAVIVSVWAGEFGEVRVWNSDGSFRWTRYLSHPPLGPATMADLDGDGRPEILVPDVTGDVLVVSGAGVIEHATTDPEILAADGPVTEIITRASGGPAPLLHWTSQGTLLAVDAATGVGFTTSRSGDGCPTAVDADGDGRLELLVPSDSLALLYVYTTGTLAGTPGEWPTSRGDMARTASTIAPGAAIVDVVPPRAVNDLHAAITGSGEIYLTWTAPYEGHDGRARSYDVRVSTGRLDSVTFAQATPLSGVPVPGVGGSRELLHVDPVDAGLVYAFALVSSDSAGNVSALSNVARADASPPLGVTDLRLEGRGATSLRLAWTSTGNSGHDGQAAAFDVRASTQPIDARNFNDAELHLFVAATSGAGVIQSVELDGLVPGLRYWAALRAIDTFGAPSPISNVVISVRSPLEGRAGIGIAAARSPGPAPVSLFWQSDAALPQASSQAPRVLIFDVTGRLCRSLSTTAGAEGVLVWNGSNDDGESMPSGLYFARFTTATATATTRFVLLR